MKTKRNNKGLVLVGVLWIVIVLTAIVAVLGRKSRLDGKLVLARSEAVRTKWACRAGIERAVALLNEDEKDVDGPYDIWASSPSDFNDFQLTRCTYNVIVSDESGKLNINTATWDQLMGLPGMYEDIADAIIDWRDSDEEVSPMGTEYGYYEDLTFGYPIRNTPFRTIRELLLVKGVTDEMFYGEDTNLNGRLDYNEMDGDLNPPNDNGDSWLDSGWAAYITCYTDSTETGEDTQAMASANQNTNNSAIITTAANSGQNAGSFTITPAVNTGSTTISYAGAGGAGGTGGQTTTQQNQTTTQQDQTTTQQDTQQQDTQQEDTQDTTTQDTAEETVTGGYVNINTASEVVLAALMGGDNQAIATAQGIIGYRESTEYGIEDISELTDAGLISDDMLSMIQDYVTTQSNIFKITCTATADRGGSAGTTLRTEAVIDRSTSPYKILYWYQGASN